MSGPDARGGTGLTGVSASFQAFLSEAPGHAQAWIEAAQKLGAASAAGSTCTT